jgi:hypothetical protein
MVPTDSLELRYREVMQKQHTVVGIDSRKGKAPLAARSFYGTQTLGDSPWGLAGVLDPKDEIAEIASEYIAILKLKREVLRVPHSRVAPRRSPAAVIALAATRPVTCKTGIQ